MYVIFSSIVSLSLREILDILGIFKKEIVNREEEREKDRRREMEMGLRECVIKKV